MQQHACCNVCVGSCLVLWLLCLFGYDERKTISRKGDCNVYVFVSIKWQSHDQLRCAAVNYRQLLDDTWKLNPSPQTAVEPLIPICMQHGTREFCCVSVTLFFMQNESWTNFLITLLFNGAHSIGNSEAILARTQGPDAEAHHFTVYLILIPDYVCAPAEL